MSQKCSEPPCSFSRVPTGCRPAVGQKEHRGVQRRPDPDHHRGAAGRRRLSPLPHALPADPRAIPPGTIFSTVVRFTLLG